MRLYLDEDTAGARLVQFLRRAGHDVQVPANAGLAGEWERGSPLLCCRQDNWSLV